VAPIDPAETAHVALELGAEIVSTPNEADGLRAWIGAGDDVVLAASGLLQAIPIAGAVVALVGASCAAVASREVRWRSTIHFAIDEVAILGRAEVPITTPMMRWTPSRAEM
jgi:hypothetical protein